MITDAQIESLPTPRLLAYYKKHAHSSKINFTRDELQEMINMVDHMAAVKKELDEREHVKR
ncbi:MAG: hypothetical protein KAS36_07280 [Anaerolineales bacterium]|nr:hypothetical protein [Anaerolineales bacterium]